MALELNPRDLGGGGILKICLVGPCSPHDLLDVLTDFQSEEYGNVGFYRGIPVSTLATELLKANHEVEIVSTATGLETEELVFRGERLKITIVQGSASARNRALTLFFADRRNIVKVIRETDAEIYHAHWTYEFALATLMTKKNVLVTAHDSPFTILRYYRDPYRFLRLVLAWIVRLKCRNLAAVSPNLARSWRRQMMWSENISILPNFIPSDFSRLGILRKEKERIVLCVSDGSKLKNVKTLVHAWQLVYANVANFSLVLVGHGLGKDQEVHRWAVTNGLDSNIVWKGYLDRTEMRDLMDSSMLLCHPSLEESHCLVLLEALSLGLPIVAGEKSGAVPWSLGDAAVLVDVRSKTQVADAILRIINSPLLRDELAYLGVNQVLSNFSSEKLLREYLDTYAKITEKH
jgi:L-malate glycosyltransferase